MGCRSSPDTASDSLEWLGLLVEGFLPAALLGVMAAGLISQANSTRQNIVLSFVRSDPSRVAELGAQ
jgi:hypothetical protein